MCQSLWAHFGGNLWRLLSHAGVPQGAGQAGFHAASGLFLRSEERTLTLHMSWVLCCTLGLLMHVSPWLLRAEDQAPFLLSILITGERERGQVTYSPSLIHKLFYAVFQQEGWNSWEVGERLLDPLGLRKTLNSSALCVGWEISTQGCCNKAGHRHPFCPFKPKHCKVQERITAWEPRFYLPPLPGSECCGLWLWWLRAGKREMFGARLLPCEHWSCPSGTRRFADLLDAQGHL